MIERAQLDFTHWPYALMPKPWEDTQQLNIAQDEGLSGVELFPDGKSSLVREKGLINPMMLPTYGDKHAPFEIGFASPEAQWLLVKAETERLIKVAGEHGFPNVIVFTGYGEPGNEARDLCVQRLVEMNKVAAQHGVYLCLEHLNNHKFEGPMGGMMGHPGYMGHDMNWVAGIVQAAQDRFLEDKRVQLLFDWYHVRIMHPGQEYEMFEKYLPLIGHIHLAQHPGRSDLDAQGELKFDQIAGTISDSSYRKGVGIEFVPKQDRDPLAGLLESIKIVTGES